jgi:hypothetical protein
MNRAFVVAVGGQIWVFGGAGVVRYDPASDAVTTFSDGKDVARAQASTVVVDAVPPALAVVRPQPGSVTLFDAASGVGAPSGETVVVGPVTVTVDAPDASTRARVTFVASTGDAATLYRPPCALPIDAVPAGESREVTVEIAAVDHAGNAATVRAAFTQEGARVANLGDVDPFASRLVNGLCKGLGVGGVCSGLVGPAPYGW